MNIGIWLSTMGGSPLQVGMERGLAQLGHQVSAFREGAPHDLVLMFNQSAHTTAYQYPEFPRGGCPIAFLDTAEYGQKAQGNHAAFRHGFAAGSVAHDTKNCEEQLRLLRFLEGRSFPYFLREMWLDCDYPSSFHPIDYPLYLYSATAPAPNRDEYLRRTVPIACIWGHSNPRRVKITERLRGWEGSDVYVVDEDGPRLAQKDYFRRMERARTTITSDGYGTSAFRLQEGMIRTAVLVDRLPIRMRKRPEHGHTCFEFDGDPSSVLADALNDPEQSWLVYKQGHDWCREHWSEQATAKYVLDVVEAHDWSVPTCV